MFQVCSVQTAENNTSEELYGLKKNFFKPSRITKSKTVRYMWEYQV